MSTEINRFHFDDSFQQGIFQLMMSDGDFCHKASMLLKPEFFKNEYYAYFFETISTLYDKYKSSPTAVQMLNEILKIKEENRETYKILLAKIYQPTMARDFAYIRDNLASFVKRCIRWQLQKKLQDPKNSDPEMGSKIIETAMEELSSVNFDEDDYLSLRDSDRIMRSSADLSKNLIPLGLPTIDEALGGGVPRGTLTTVIGGTNVGKSISLVNFAFHMGMNGFRVLYVNLEGQENQPLLRLVSRATQIKYGHVRFNMLNDNQLMKKKDVEAKLGDMIHIKHVKKIEYSVEELYSYCKSKKEKFDFDAVLVDYGQLLSSKKKMEGMRHEMAYVHRYLDNIASNLGVAVITVAQGTRDTQEKNRKGTDLLRMGDISECFAIIRVSAQVLTINRSEADEVNERVRILLEKQRDGKKGVMEICKTNFQTISMFGSKEEGLGFISTDEYLADELASSEQVMGGKPTVSIK